MKRYDSVLKALSKIKLDGRQIIELFTEIPDAITYPDYRDIVSTPISLNEIRKRVRLNSYDTDDQLIADFELMAENARAYNGDESPVYDDATDILDFILLYFDKEVSKQSRIKLQLLIVFELENYKIKGRKLGESFINEVDVELYPSYLDVVKQPTSFTKVRKLIETQNLSWDKFKEECALVFNNAMAYNQEGSVIYNDAKTLKKQLDSKLAKYSAVPKHLQLQLPTNEESSEDESVSVELNEAPRFDDDDDEDFEADSEDVDEDDMDVEEQPQQDSNLPVIPGIGVVPPHFFNIPPVYDEIVYRPPEQTYTDALLPLVTFLSKGKSDDVFKLKILPSNTKLFTTYATTLPFYNANLSLKVSLNEQVKHLEVTVMLNGGVVKPNAEMEYDLQLALGLNQVSVIAIKGFPDFIRQAGPVPLADAEADEERVVVFFNLEGEQQAS